MHCDILVIGAGPAGLAAALTAARAGADIIVADEDFALGGRLNSETFAIGDDPGVDWVAAAVAELASLANVRLMPRTTVIGAFDHGIYGALERVSDHLAVPVQGKPRQMLWRIYAKRSLLCAGATERPIAFENNDRPGIMLAGSLADLRQSLGCDASAYVAVFTNNDDGHRTAADLISKGVQVAAIIDTRADAPRIANCELLPGAVIVDTSGRLGLASIKVRTISGETRTINCGALGVSGGWNPNVHLTCHQRGRPHWDETLAAFVPGDGCPKDMTVAGAANGDISTAGGAGVRARDAATALADLGIKANPAELPQAEDAPINLSPFWHVAGSRRGLARPAERCHRQGHETVASGRLSLGRASQALHHAGHGDRSGQDREYGRPGGDGRTDRQDNSGNRHNDFPSALYTGTDRGLRGPIDGQGFPAHPPYAQPQVGRRTRRDLRRGRHVAARTVVSARRGNPLAAIGRPRSSGHPKICRHLRRDHPGQDRRARRRMRPHFSTGSMPMPSASLPSARSAMA